jgi:hypothetical protein
MAKRELLEMMRARASSSEIFFMDEPEEKSTTFTTFPFPLGDRRK